MVCLTRSCNFKWSKGCHSQILFGPFPNKLSQAWQLNSNYIFPKSSDHFLSDQNEKGRHIYFLFVKIGANYSGVD